MRNVNCTVLSATDGQTTNGSAIDSNQLVSASFHAYFGDSTAAGTLKLQASNDIYNARYNYPEGNFTPTNWTDIPNQSVVTTLGAPKILTVANMSYRWIRAVFTIAAPSVGASAIIQDLTYTAKALGPSGELINITYVDPGLPNAALSVVVSINDITVNLATNVTLDLTSTATQIAAAIAASIQANALVSVAVSGTGSNVQTSQSQTFLTSSSGGYTTINVNMNALSI